MKGRYKMHITIVTTVYKQRGPILDFYNETEKQYQTDKYSYDVISGTRNLLNDFRKNELFFDTNKVSFKKLYLDGLLVAMLEPRFIINNELIETWSDCVVFTSNIDLSITDTKVIKQLTHYNTQNIIDILSK